MTFNPQNILGETRVETNYSFNCTLELENTSTPTETITEEIESIEITPSSDYVNYIITNNIINFYGNIPLDVFDLYKFKYVDKGSSDKIMTPVITNIYGVPDRKDLFEVTPDTRQSVQVPNDSFINVKVQIKRTITEISTPPAEPTDPIIEYIDYEHNYKITATQDMDLLKNWIKDYFENRYN